MIDPIAFNASRELARSKLSADEAQNSFGYWIDIPNDWENFSSYADLVGFLSIHRTHLVKFEEILEDLGSLNEFQRGMVYKYVKVYENIARLLATTVDYKSNDLRYDVAESLFSWKIISKFASFPCNILDFGAGAARYGVMSYLQDKDNCYTAIDATLAAYTVQNLVLSYLDINQKDQAFYEFLDYEKRPEQFPLLDKNNNANRYHIPVWKAEELLQARKQDVIIASFVHGELSKPDFLRLVNVLNNTLADDGIVYVRSELTWGNTRDFHGAVDLHGLELLKLLSDIDIYPVWCKYYGGYLTTVFARKNSSHYMLARSSQSNEYQFLDIKESRDISLLAAEHYITNSLSEVITNRERVVVFGDTHLLYEKFITPIESKFTEINRYPTYDQITEKNADLLANIHKNDPDVIIIISNRCLSFQYCLEFEENLSHLLAYNFPLRRAYPFYSLMILYRKQRIKPDSIFGKAIYTTADVTVKTGGGV